MSNVGERCKMEATIKCIDRCKETPLIIKTRNNDYHFGHNTIGSYTFLLLTSTQSQDTLPLIRDNIMFRNVHNNNHGLSIKKLCQNEQSKTINAQHVVRDHTTLLQIDDNKCGSAM